MNAKEKAVKLVKISFDKIAKATNYKGVAHDKGFKFGLLNDLSKAIALDYVNEIIQVITNIETEHACGFNSYYWQEVKNRNRKVMMYKNKLRHTLKLIAYLLLFVAVFKGLELNREYNIIDNLILTIYERIG